MPWDVWLIFFVLGVIVPWRGRYRLRELLAKPAGGSAERVSLYLSTIVFQWLTVGVVSWRAWVHGFSANQLGLVARNAWSVGITAILGAALLAIFQWCNLRRMGHMPEKTREKLQALAERILPQSTAERFPFFALAVTAGVCEEFLYRGFAIAAFTRAGLPLWSVVVLSSVLFGLAHLYQGRGGLVGTMLLGLFFGVARITFGSLVPVMAWHISVDIVAGLAGPLYLINKSTVTVNLGWRSIS
jgi:membrane protease YdiL (CAAX protease family)